MKFIQGGSTATGGLMLYAATDGHLAWRSSADVFLSVTKSLAVNTVAGGVAGLTGLSFGAGGSTASGGLQLYTATDGGLSWRDSANTLLPLQRGLSVSTAAGGSTAAFYAVAFTQGGSTATGGLMLYVDTGGNLCFRGSAGTKTIIGTP